MLQTAQLYTRQVKVVRNQVLSQGNKLKNINNQDIMRLTQNEEVLNQYLSSLIPLSNVYEAILTGRYVAVYEDDNDLLQDLVISIRQSVDICTVNLKSIRSVRDSYQIIFSNRLNDVIRFLTSFTIILTIPTIIASLYGMNINLPFQNSPWAFVMVIGSIIVASGIAWLVFYWRKWL